MYSLKVLKGFIHKDGRVFDPDHPCNSLSAFEVAELVVDYPANFEGSDEITKELIKDKEKMKHLHDAKGRK